MGDSKIEWTDRTWNPIRGCSVVSEGCRNCYAMNFATRFAKEGEAYDGLAYRNSSGAHWTGKVKFIEEHLEDPLRWRAPKRIFVNSMSDLFHESIPDEWIDRIFAVMALAPQHAFQVLTKRPKRMLAYTQRLAKNVGPLERPARAMGHTFQYDGIPLLPWPIPNVWLGVSVEDQKTADERIPLLLQTPAAVRFISYEPALGSLDLSDVRETLPDGQVRSKRALVSRDSLFGVDAFSVNRLDWVIVGAESGNGARPLDLDWPRLIVKDCKAAGVAVFVKQLGAHPVDWRHDVPEAPPYEYSLSKKGGSMDEWPDDLRVREFPTAKGVTA